MPRTEERIGGLRVAAFGPAGSERRRALVAAIRSGRKTATTGLVEDYAARGVALPRVGERFVVLGAEDAPAAVIETTEVRILTPPEIDLAFVRAEGAGYGSVDEWRADHARVFAGAAGGFDADTPIVAERFRLVSATA